MGDRKRKERNAPKFRKRPDYYVKFMDEIEKTEKTIDEAMRKLDKNVKWEKPYFKQNPRKEVDGTFNKELLKLEKYNDLIKIEVDYESIPKNKLVLSMSYIKNYSNSRANSKPTKTKKMNLREFRPLEINRFILNNVFDHDTEEPNKFFKDRT